MENLNKINDDEVYVFPSEKGLHETQIPIEEHLIEQTLPDLTEEASSLDDELEVSSPEDVFFDGSVYMPGDNLGEWKRGNIKMGNPIQNEMSNPNIDMIQSQPNQSIENSPIVSQDNNMETYPHYFGTPNPSPIKR